MVIQYGYLALFAPAFSLAPLFAMINNIFEIRSAPSSLSPFRCVTCEPERGDREASEVRQ